MNVVFILVDTLRASRLGCYGYHLPTSPAMDSLAHNGVLFERCFAPGVPTTPAHTTIYTGVHPLTHNIVSHGGAADLERRFKVLPELLQQAGYTTAAFDNLYDIKPWLARGYEYYINSSFKHKMRLLITCEEINARAVPWIRNHASEQFFMFLHYWEPHTPYVPPDRYRTFYPKDRDPYSLDHTSFEPIKRQPFWGMFKDLWFDRLGPVTDAEYVASLYDAEIRHVDDGISEILETLDACGLRENTLVILTGDHGESMYQHDIFFDHHGLYEDVVHVPLIMSSPGRLPAGVRLNGMVQHLDLAGTVLEAAGAPQPAELEGKSLWKAASDGSSEYGWQRVFCCENTWQSKWAIRTEDSKLIVARRPDRHGMPARELYNLRNDPLELENLAETQSDVANEMQAELEEWIREGLARVGRTEDPIVAQPITLGTRWERQGT